MKSKMKLLGSPTSPFVRKVRMLEYELDLSLEFKAIMVREPDDEFLALSPIGKIPVLITELGESIPESDLISRYLCSKTENTGFFPQNFDLEFERTLVYINAALDSSAAIIMESWRSEDKIDADIIARHRNRVARVLSALDARGERVLHEKRYIELALATLLGYVDFRQSVSEWRASYPFLGSWYSTILNRPYFVETLPAQS